MQSNNQAWLQSASSSHKICITIKTLNEDTQIITADYF